MRPAPVAVRVCQLLCESAQRPNREPLNKPKIDDIAVQEKRQPGGELRVMRIVTPLYSMLALVAVAASYNRNDRIGPTSSGGMFCQYCANSALRVL